MVFIDPFHQGFVYADEIKIILEQLARGRYTKEPTLISEGFANAMTYALQVWSDLGSKTINNQSNPTIDSKCVRQAFDSETLNVSLLNQTLRAHWEFKGITELIEKMLKEKIY